MSAPTGASHSDLLIPTKLHQPRMHQTVLARPHLWQRLQEGLSCEVILLCAPAGYGKTTLLSTWLQQDPCAVSWLSLDEADSELSTFLGYLVALLQTVEPIAGTHLSTLQGDTDALSIRYIAQLLINDLMELHQESILVLEDYHLIAADSPVHQLMSMVLEYLPPNVHVVITTRFDPPLPLARWRASGSIFEVRANHLAWSLEELNAYVEHSLHVAIAADHLDTLHKRTEGWPAGIQLALFALQQQTERNEFMTAFATSNRFVMEYLADEVLSRLQTSTHDFILKVSILDRCCPALCALVTGMTEKACRNNLTWLASHNMFTVALDVQNEWFRFHPTFQELLHARLAQQISDAEIFDLHRRASDWLAQHGQVEAALHHALAVGDLETAAQLVEQNTDWFLNRERFAVLRRWLYMLPPALIHARPGLLLTKICILLAQNVFVDTMDLLQEAQRLLQQTDGTHDQTRQRAWWGEWTLHLGAYWYWRGEGERSATLALQALGQIPESSAYLRGLAYYYLGNSYQLRGQLPLAVQQLQTLLADPQINDAAIRSRLWLALCMVYLMAGEWHQMVVVARHMQKEAYGNDQPANTGWAHYALGLVQYEWNHLDAAAKHFSTVIDQRQRVRLDTLVNCYFGQALVHQARGQTEQAHACLDDLLDTLLQDRNTTLLQDVDAFRARLALRQGKLELASSWARTVEREFPHGPTPFIEVPLLTQVRILIAQKTPSSLRRASDLLATALERAEQLHNHWRTLEIRALQALTLAALEQPEDALAALEQAVTLAERGGFLRIFVDLGPPMARLLRMLHGRATLSDSLQAYVQTVLAAFPPVDPQAAAVETASVRPAAPVEPLTDRELQVLELLAQRLMAKEIAEELVISIGTVKKHASNIYQKLHVNDRRQAVVRARALGILPPQPD